MKILNPLTAAFRVRSDTHAPGPHGSRVYGPVETDSQIETMRQDMQVSLQRIHRFAQRYQSVAPSEERQSIDLRRSHINEESAAQRTADFASIPLGREALIRAQATQTDQDPHPSEPLPNSIAYQSKEQFQ